MENPKYIIKKAADEQFFWERTAINGEGVAYSLPDRFTQKHTVFESIEADIRSLLTILGFANFVFERANCHLKVSFGVETPGLKIECFFEIDDQTL